MTITDIVNLFVNNGVAIAVVVYFMYRDYKFNQNMIELLTAIKLLLKGDENND